MRAEISIDERDFAAAIEDTLRVLKIDPKNGRATLLRTLSPTQTPNLTLTLNRNPKPESNPSPSSQLALTRTLTLTITLMFVHVFSMFLQISYVLSKVVTHFEEMVSSRER